ncbi:MAG: hypothetical protein FD129_1728 [bacterium]|nr:MAG: hypothetical protein FD129_1728 [bacterium]
MLISGNDSRPDRAISYSWTVPRKIPCTPAAFPSLARSAVDQGLANGVPPRICIIVAANCPGSTTSATREPRSSVMKTLAILSPERRSCERVENGMTATRS